MILGSSSGAVPLPNKNNISVALSEAAATEIDLDELLAYFKFNESSGNLINQAANVGSTDEISGNGTNTGVTYSQTGIIGDAYLYDGTNDMTSIDTLTTSTTASGSLNIWANFPAFNDSSLWAFGDANADENLYIELIPASSKIQGVCKKAGTTQWRFTSDAISSATDTWHMITITQNATTVKIFIDSVEGTTFSDTTDKTAWIPDLTGLDNFRVCARNDDGDGNARFCNALTDEMSYWGRVLTQDEINTLYNSGSGHALP